MTGCSTMDRNGSCSCLLNEVVDEDELAAHRFVLEEPGIDRDVKRSKQVLGGGLADPLEQGDVDPTSDQRREAHDFDDSSRQAEEAPGDGLRWLRGPGPRHRSEGEERV